MPMEPKNWLRVKAHLQANDGRMHASDLSRALDMKSSVLIAAVRPGLNSGELTREHDGRLVVYVLGEKPAAGQGDAGEFLARMDTDGDLDLHGFLELEDGGVRLTPPMVAKLKRLIAWSPAA